MRLRRSWVRGGLPFLGGAVGLVPTDSNVIPSFCSQPDASMAPGTVRNHQPCTPGMLGTGPGSVNTSSRVNGRAARKVADLLLPLPFDTDSPIVVRAHARLEGSLGPGYVTSPSAASS